MLFGECERPVNGLERRSEFTTATAPGSLTGLPDARKLAAARRFTPRSGGNRGGQAGLRLAWAAHPLAGIDIGSNSGRVVVVRVSNEGHLRIVADERSPLRL